MSLEDTIRDLAKRGEISDLSLYRNPGNTKWIGTFAPASKHGVTRVEHDDPVEALRAAIDTTKLRKTRERVTATVIDPEPAPPGEPESAPEPTPEPAAIVEAPATGGYIWDNL